ncbi:MAG: YtxH domain-containing protein [Campylobacteraceae bacterium]|nr:YtxH domain-containing protein [Campylobacteraceae bacterium]
MNNNPYNKFIGSSSKRPNKRGNPFYNLNEDVNAKSKTNASGPVDAVQSALGGFNSSDFLKGALIGAAAAYLLSNKKVQESLFKTVAKGSSMFQMGMEELKERYEDAQAEFESTEE